MAQRRRARWNASAPDQRRRADAPPQAGGADDAGCFAKPLASQRIMHYARR
jgi:hypothetical protein